jgi:hypothetical protein
MTNSREILIQIVGMGAGGLLVVCNIIWYRAKFAIKRKGYPISLLCNHLQDYPNLKKIVAEETDPEEKQKYQKLLHHMNIMWALFFTALLMLVSVAIMVETGE